MSLFASELFAEPLFVEDAPVTASPAPLFKVTRDDSGTPFTFLAPLKDPNSIELHGLDWSDWLGNGDSLASATVTADTGLTVDQVTNAAGVVSYRLSGGTAGMNYIATCRVVTAFGLVDDRSVQYRVRER